MPQSKSLEDMLCLFDREREEEEGIEAARRRKIEDEKAEDERKRREKIEQMRKAAQMKREAVSFYF